MKKLLLGLIASLALISTTLYAACTANVDMGNFKIENLANGTVDGDAVNYAQTLKLTTVDVPESNASILTSHPSYNVMVSKVGNICFMSGTVQVMSESNLTAQLDFGIVPVGYRPVQEAWYSGAHNGGTQWHAQVAQTNRSGALKINPNLTANGQLVSGQLITVGMTYICM